MALNENRDSTHRKQNEFSSFLWVYLFRSLCERNWRWKVQNNRDIITWYHTTSHNRDNERKRRLGAPTANPINFVTSTLATMRRIHTRFFCCCSKSKHEISPRPPCVAANTLMNISTYIFFSNSRHNLRYYNRGGCVSYTWTAGLVPSTIDTIRFDSIRYTDNHIARTHADFVPSHG